jgi:hypothetical protein
MNAIDRQVIELQESLSDEQFDALIAKAKQQLGIEEDIFTDEMAESIPAMLEAVVKTVKSGSFFVTTQHPEPV